MINCSVKYWYLTCLVFFACQSEEVLPIEEILLENAENSSLPNLNILANGDILLSYVQDSNDTTSLFLNKITPAGQQTKKLIDRGTDWFVNWADYPITHVFSDQSKVLLHWLEKSTTETYDYNIICRTYNFDNDSISAPFKLNDSNLPAEYGFVSSTPYKDGLQMMWLDGRNTKNDNGAMNLRTTFVPSKGNRRISNLLDDRVCDCCQTSLSSDGERIVGFYRDRSHTEVRDVSMVLFDSIWHKPKLFSKDF